MRNTRDHASSLVREFRSLVLAGFDESQVEALLRPILNITNVAELETLAQVAWKCFLGHPFLTHLWADSLAGQKGRYNLELALQNITEKADENLFKPFRDNLDDATCLVLQRSPALTIDALTLSALDRLCLRDSGLFVVDGLGVQARFDFAGTWIRFRLASVLAQKS